MPETADGARTTLVDAIAAVRSGARRVGGPSSTSWSTIASMGAVLVVDRIGTDLEATGAPLRLVSSALIGTLAIAAILRTARLTLRRGGTDRPRPGAAALVLLTAATAATFAGRAHDLAVGLPVPPGVGHLVERSVWGLAFLIIVAIGVDAVTEHRVELSRLMARAATLQRTRVEVDALLAAGARDELERVTAQVRTDLSDLESADVASALARLRHAGEEVVRARSHELARPSPPYRAPDPLTIAETPSLLALAAEATTDRPFRPAVLSVIVGLWVTVGALATASTPMAVLTGVGLGASAGLTFAAADRLVRPLLARRTPRGRIGLVLAATVAAALTWVSAGHLVATALGIPLVLGGGPVRIGAQALLVSAIPIAQALARAARRRGELAVAEGRALTEALEVEVARANSALWARRRALARALHGPVQAAINAATLRLAAIEDRHGPIGPALARARSEVEAALATLERAVGDDALGVDDDLRQAVERIRGLWAGVADVAIDLPAGLVAELANDPIVTAALIDVLTEACSNAVRHGRATRIDVRIEPGPDRVTLEVIDDGRTVSSGAPGQGSALLDEVALAWRRASDAAGTRLTVSLARS